MVVVGSSGSGCSGGSGGGTGGGGVRVPQEACFFNFFYLFFFSSFFPLFFVCFFFEHKNRMIASRARENIFFS